MRSELRALRAVRSRRYLKRWPCFRITAHSALLEVLQISRGPKLSCRRRIKMSAVSRFGDTALAMYTKVSSLASTKFGNGWIRLAYRGESRHYDLYFSYKTIN